MCLYSRLYTLTPRTHSTHIRMKKQKKNGVVNIIFFILCDAFDLTLATVELVNIIAYGLL